MSQYEEQISQIHYSSEFHKFAAHYNGVPALLALLEKQCCLHHGWGPCLQHHPGGTPAEGYTIIFTPTETTILKISAILLALLGTMANGLLLVSLLLAPRIRALSMTRFIIFLCTSDLLFSIYSLPIIAARFLNREDQAKKEEIMCQSGPIIFFTLVGSTALIFVVISVQRAGILFFRERVERVFPKNINIIFVLLCWTI